MRVCGIDSGLSGGMAIYEPGIEIILSAVPVFWQGPSRRVHGRILMEWLQDNRADIAFVENVWSRPGEGGSSGFRFGRAVGAIESAVQCAKVRMRLVAPITWKLHHGLSPRRVKGAPKPPSSTPAEIKERSRLFAIKTFPEAAEMLALHKAHNLAEALLVAAYGAHVMSEQPMENRDAAGA